MNGSINRGERKGIMLERKIRAMIVRIAIFKKGFLILLSMSQREIKPRAVINNTVKKGD